MGAPEAQLHAEDLENRSRRQNLRLRGIPEAPGPENLTETVQASLHKVLEGDPPATLELDKVHRALGPKPMDVERPHNVICRLHCYGLKEQIVRAARLKGLVDFDGEHILIYPDVSLATLLRRAMLKLLLEVLCRGELPYRWGFLIQLTILKKNDSFTLRRHAKLLDLFDFLEMELIPLWDC